MTTYVIALRPFLAAVWLALWLPALAAGPDALRPDIVIANPGHCIAPAAEMRRNHPDMLKHQRDVTVHTGTRGARVSLNACIDCHANRSNHSVLGTDRSFCQGCHQFAAVRLDCFECHQASTTSAAPLALAPARP